MVGITILILALITLYILSRIFIRKLFYVLFRITRSREKATVLLGWIFLPGTFIHEIAHFLSALLMIVPVGQLNLIPEVVDDGIKLGSVGIGKTDFVRGSIIGLAPILTGGGIIFWGISFAISREYLQNPWVIALIIYSIFQITHTMFSSKKDLGAVLELVVFIAIVSIALLILKIYSPFTYIFQKIMEVGPVIEKFAYLLFIPIGVELGFLAIFRKVKIQQISW
ncbi:MAG: hypothetical protein UU16_C0021G0028 [Candidatus Woesebacteria bacterium GW2011_GWA2_40_7]|uniref:Uncharacterized protein n=3 Tax=Candidatus Woeseibacteriota TaxID=1752722 RepID=A0A0G0P0P5_9BACT|nr:MAG: hypothetical protein UT17_C0004G0002 [Candidatus Woesebacteria bacterium GW2011_GWB1_39_10]KKR73468.1 MAG: hypothetical protein UU16_C0021G0028 [Candidatus Woesebacteria bacterium GW2011_GWA2_40_7]KKS90645.1 MAG: hypothetical protein UV66_C0001G0002 [Candidatus Woesebacteria bacterium GW2011_GWA1_43_12]